MGNERKDEGSSAESAQDHRLIRYTPYGTDKFWVASDLAVLTSTRSRTGNTLGKSLKFD